MTVKNRKRSYDGQKKAGHCGGGHCCRWTDFQLAIMISAHDDDFEWLSEEEKETATSRLRMTKRQVQTMHHSFKLRESGCNGGYPMPRKIAAPSTGNFYIADM